MPLFGDFCEVLAKMEKVALFRLVCGALCKISKALPYSSQKIFFFSEKNSGVGKYFFKKNFQTDFFVGVPMCLWVNYTSNLYGVWMD